MSPAATWLMPSAGELPLCHNTSALSWLHNVTISLPGWILCKEVLQLP